MVLELVCTDHHELRCGLRQDRGAAERCARSNCSVPAAALSAGSAPSGALADGAVRRVPRRYRPRDPAARSAVDGAPPSRLRFRAGLVRDHHPVALQPDGGDRCGPGDAHRQPATARLRQRAGGAAAPIGRRRRPEGRRRAQTRGWKECRIGADGRSLGCLAEVVTAAARSAHCARRASAVLDRVYRVAAIPRGAPQGRLSQGYPARHLLLIASDRRCRPGPSTHMAHDEQRSDAADSSSSPQQPFFAGNSTMPSWAILVHRRMYSGRWIDIPLGGGVLAPPLVPGDRKAGVDGDAVPLGRRVGGRGGGDPGLDRDRPSVFRP